MTENDSEFPLTLRKKGQEVTLYKGHDRRRGHDYFTVIYHLGGVRRRTTRKSFEEAKELAEGVLEKMAKGRVPVSLSHDDWELLKKLKKVARDRSAWRLLEDAGAAGKLLGKETSLTEAAEFWMSRNQHRSKIKVRELYEQYIRHLEQDASERHLRDARNRVGKFEESFRNQGISDLTAEAIREFLQSLDVENRTRNNYRAQIITFFRWAQKRDFLEQGRKTAPEFIDPWKVIEKEVSIFTIKQTQLLFDGLREDLIAYAAIAAFAGLRPSEIQRLKWDAIDFGDEHIYVSPDVAKKVGRSRYVPMHRNLVNWLEPVRRGGDEKVCYLKAPELLSKDARERDIIADWPTDVLRHSFVSYRLAETSDIGLVSEEAGNSPQIIRKHYRRPIRKGLAQDYFGISPD